MVEKFIVIFTFAQEEECFDYNVNFIVQYVEMFYIPRQKITLLT